MNIENTIDYYSELTQEVLNLSIFIERGIFD